MKLLLPKREKNVFCISKLRINNFDNVNSKLLRNFTNMYLQPFDFNPFALS